MMNERKLIQDFTANISPKNSHEITDQQEEEEINHILPSHNQGKK
jgi:hypothetical protein